MIRLAHLINPVPVGPDSDLFVAQPISFETMRLAREYALVEQTAAVDLLAVQVQDETDVLLPREFHRLPALTRCAVDIGSFRIPRNLPLIADLLDRLYHNSDADYLIYSNVDIALQPYFYSSVTALIRQDLDGFIINRRTIPGHYTSPRELPLMYAEAGEKHPGWDCFVFKRDLFPRFELERVLIGTGWIGRALICNLALPVHRFKVFETLHLTFHIGNDQVWRNVIYADYLEHNREECRRILNYFDHIHGPLDRDALPGRFFRLLDRGGGGQLG